MYIILGSVVLSLSLCIILYMFNTEFTHIIRKLNLLPISFTVKLYGDWHTALQIHSAIHQMLRWRLPHLWRNLRNKSIRQWMMSSMKVLLNKTIQMSFEIKYCTPFGFTIPIGGLIFREFLGGPFFKVFPRLPTPSQVIIRPFQFLSVFRITLTDK